MRTKKGDARTEQQQEELEHRHLTFMIKLQNFFGRFGPPIGEDESREIAGGEVLNQEVVDSIGFVDDRLANKHTVGHIVGFGFQ
jgi:hypothetical protein